MADTNKITYVSKERLGYYDTRLKAWVKAEDDALKAALQANIDAANTAVSNEETARKAADATLATDIATAQAAADKAQGEVDALETYVGTFTSENAKTVIEYIDEVATGASSDNSALADRVKAIEDDYLVAQDRTDLEGLITAEETRAKGIEGGLEIRLAAVEADYLKAADKTELAGLISAEAETARAAEEANAAAIKAISDDYLVEADKTELSNAITAEKERAEGIEADLEERLAAVEGDYLVKADKEALAADIKVNTDAIAVLNGDGDGSVAKQVADAVAGIVNGAPEAYDTLKEISDWIEAHPDSVAEINSAIKDNKDAIDALETHVGELPEDETSENVVAFIQKLVKAEEDRAKGVEGGLDTRLQTLENKFTGEGSVEDQIEDALEEAKGYTDELANGAVADNAAAIEVLNGDATTEGSVAKAIADAKTAIDADIDAVEAKADENAEAIAAINNAETGILKQAKDYADAEDAKIESRVDALEAASATHALASDLTALAGRVTTAEGEIDTLQTEMDAVEALAAANKAAHEANAAAIALKASQADLEAEVKARQDGDAALQAQIDAFEECTTGDIDALFA